MNEISSLVLVSASVFASSSYSFLQQEKNKMTNYNQTMPITTETSTPDLTTNNIVSVVNDTKKQFSS